MMGEASNTSIVRASVMRSASGVQSLSRPSMRRLEPAAAIMAEDVTCIFQLLLWFGARRLGGLNRRNATYPPLLFWVRKNHPSRYSLQNTGYGNFDCRTHVLATAFHHDHCTIIQVAYSLAQFLAILYDFDNNIFSR